MDHIKILKRALSITVNYRMLWVFGILLVLAGGGGGGGGGNPGFSGSSNNNRFNGNNPFNGNNNPFSGNNNPFTHLPAFPELTPAIINTIIGVAVALLCILILVEVTRAFVRYVSETALIRMVDKHETSGEKPGFREGFHMGWSRAAWRMFLVDLLTGLSFLVVFLAALIIAALPFLVWLTQSVPLQVLGSVIGAGLVLLVIFASVLVSLALGLIVLFARRAVALEDLGVIESIRRGFNMVKGRLMDVLLMGVIMFGITLVWSLLMIPVFLAIILAAALLSGLPALLVGGIAGLFAQGFTPWLIAAIVGVPIFLIAMIIPGAIIGGWQQVFTSSTWTLTFRETAALEKTNGKAEPPAPEPAPAAA